MILLYHGVSDVKYGENQSVKTFEKHIKFISKNFKIIPYHKYSLENHQKKEVVLTFDDGFKNNYTNIKPILEKYNTPAIFFINNRHSERGKYLWFAYLSALENFFNSEGFTFRGKYYDMSKKNRKKTVNKLKSLLFGLDPYPHAMYSAIDNELPRVNGFMSDYEINDTIKGLSSSEISEISKSDLFDIGIHTADHPFLTMCDSDEIKKQISLNKQYLEEIVQRKIDIIAYPSGDYSQSVIEYCKEINIKYGYAVAPIENQDQQFEYERIGIYGKSILKLFIKLKFGKIIRRFIKIG